MSKLECATCHTRSIVNCYNCHFDTEVWQGMRGFKRPIGQLKGFIMLARHVQTGKVGIVNYQSIIYQGNKTFNAWGPYYPHTIMPKDSTRTCGECHNNAVISEYNSTHQIVVAKWDSVSVPKKIVHTQGVIPIPPDYLTSLVFDFANYTGRLDTTYTNPAMWVFAKRGLNGNQMLSRYVLPLTASQMTKLGSTIGIQPINSNTPEKFNLQQNYPNPFNPYTKIRFSIQKNTNVFLRVYNSLGVLVKELIVNENMKPGEYEVEFNGSELSSGVYFCRMEAADFRQTVKMMLIK
ncbi:MAG: T9SS type A sorting domain-containing protein [Ignavibacteriae bacterium]|nr:T9SS type A sorting domain-containing protein [Ignavibacteriota bacterium]